MCVYKYTVCANIYRALHFSFSPIPKNDTKIWDGALGWIWDCAERVPANVTRPRALSLQVWRVWDEVVQDQSCCWSVLGLSPEISAPKRGHSAAEAA